MNVSKYFNCHMRKHKTKEGLVDEVKSKLNLVNAKINLIHSLKNELAEMPDELALWELIQKIKVKQILSGNSFNWIENTEECKFVMALCQI